MPTRIFVPHRKHSEYKGTERGSKISSPVIPHRKICRRDLNTKQHTWERARIKIEKIEFSNSSKSTWEYKRETSEEEREYERIKKNNVPPGEVKRFNISATSCTKHHYRKNKFKQVSWTQSQCRAARGALTTEAIDGSHSSPKCPNWINVSLSTKHWHSLGSVLTSELMNGLGQSDCNSATKSCLHFTVWMVYL